jgi:uncharacterized protein YcbX
MPPRTSLPSLVNIRIHPIKSLDPVYLNECRIGPAGGLALDRAWALHSVDGKWVTATRAPILHLVRAVYSPDLRSVTLSVPGDSRQIPTRTFAFPDAHEDASEWFSVFFDQQIIVRYSPDGFPDDPIAGGPTLVSTASLRAVCEWFPQITLEEARCRFRTNLEIDFIPDHPDTNANPGKKPGSEINADALMPAFWEDQLFGENERSVVRFKIGDIHLEGSNPCARCPIPPRNPFTGVNLDGFQKRFAQLREATLPAWSPRSRFDHFYRFAVNTRIPHTEANKLLRINDPLSFL